MSELRQALKNQFVIPVIRENDFDRMMGICQALADGGCKVFEVTQMSPAAYLAIEQLAKNSELWIGAGTVLSAHQAKAVVQIGARFLVSPGTNLEILKNPPVAYLPGVATATEVMTAVECGYDLLKVFPAQSLGGASFLKNLQAPFPNVKWMPTGGVGEENLKDYRQAGAFCVGVGGKLFPTAEIDSKNWSAITNRFKSWQQASQV